MHTVSTVAILYRGAQVIKMLVAIVLLFTICWSPTLIDNVFVELGLVNRMHHGYLSTSSISRYEFTCSATPEHAHSHHGYLRYMRQAFALMSYANSCVNPVVYAFMSKNFRAGFRKALRCRSLASAQPRSRHDAVGSLRMRHGGHVTSAAAHQGHCGAEIYIHGGDGTGGVGSMRTSPYELTTPAHRALTVASGGGSQFAESKHSQVAVVPQEELLEYLGNCQ